MKNNENIKNPLTQYMQPPYDEKKQAVPGYEVFMNIKPDHGEESYVGTGKLKGRKAIITGGDSGIGRAVAIAFAREGADVVISYLDEHADAKETAEYIEKAGQKAVLLPGDISKEEHCISIVKQAVEQIGGIDIIVNNAAFQMSRDSLQDISAEEWDTTFRVNIHPMFYICKAAEEHLQPGSTIINTTSVNAYKAPPHLIPYSATKAAIQNFTVSLAQLWAEKGIRVNCVAPGPIWTPLIPATLKPEKVEQFGTDTPLKRAGQPAELAPAFVLLASQDSSYMTGSTVQVTGGYPTI
jgi:NAD(P)-dependent dehydrogenase (short-subunit alcohol dehydrogenase family)